MRELGKGVDSSGDEGISRRVGIVGVGVTIVIGSLCGLCLISERKLLLPNS